MICNYIDSQDVIVYVACLASLCYCEQHLSEPYQPLGRMS